VSINTYARKSAEGWIRNEEWKSLRPRQIILHSSFYLLHLIGIPCWNCTSLCGFAGRRLNCSANGMRNESAAHNLASKKLVRKPGFAPEPSPSQGEMLLVTPQSWFENGALGRTRTDEYGFTKPALWLLRHGGFEN
jgi:hypothetical protein